MSVDDDLAVVSTHDFDSPDAPYQPEVLAVARAGERLADEVERLRAGVQDVLDWLEGARCNFWACPGPDHEFTPMATCNICSVVQDLRKLLGVKLITTGSDPQ